MDFEKILTLIVIMVIWGGGSILSKIAKTLQNKQSATDQKPGFFQILQQNFAAALKEAGGDEEVLEFDEYFHSPPQAQTDKHEKKSLIDTARDSLPQEPTRTDKETVSAPSPATSTLPRHKGLKKRPTLTNRRKLQNAVIWAEILAPPVALRDQ